MARLFTHCLLCRTPFPEGTLVEHLPVGRRVAYDPERGRLWTICEGCGGWTLAPIEARWEALVELERLVTGKGRVSLAGRTANISLFRRGSSEIVRIGGSSLEEEAFWRYGAPAARRHGKLLHATPFAPDRLSAGEWLLGAAHAFRVGVSGATRPMDPAAIRRWVRFGSVAWRGDHACGACGHHIHELTFFQSRTLILRDAGGEALTPSLVWACPRCRDETTGGLHLEGTEAELVLRRSLAYEQEGGVSGARLRAAVELIEGGGGASGLSRILARYERYVGELPRTSSVALRILANDAREARLLDLRAREIERQWRREEELASIIDGELTPLPRLERLRRRLRGGPPAG